MGWHSGMVAVASAGYGPGCMAARQPRRTRVRRAFLLLPIALLTTVVSVALHPAAAATPVPSVGPTPTPPRVSQLGSTHCRPSRRRRRRARHPSSRRAQGRRPATRRSSDRPCRSRALVSRRRHVSRCRLDSTVSGSVTASRDISVAIVLPDGATWSGVSGMADIGTRAPVSRETSFAIASVSKTFTAALDPRARGGRDRRSRCIRAALPPGRQEDLGQDQGPSVARPYEWPARLLLPSVHRPPAAIASRPPVGRHARAQIPRQALLGARQELALLEHELPAPRDGRGGRRQEAARATRSSSASSSRSGSTTPGISPRIRRRADVAHGYRFTSTSTAAPAIDLTDGTPLVPFTSVVTAAGGAGRLRLDGSGSRALGAGLVRRPGPPTRIPCRDGRSEHHRRVEVVDPVRLRHPGRRDRRAPHTRPFRSPAGVPVGDALHPRSRRVDRRRHQPEPYRPGAHRPVTAEARPHAGRSHLRLPGASLASIRAPAGPPATQHEYGKVTCRARV